MKRFMVYALVFFIFLNLMGCEAVRKKFTRKTKEVKMPRIYQVNKYEKKPTPELYKKHFSYWRTWQSELIQKLGDNHKKDLRCSEEIVSNLRDMQGILVPEMADKLEPHIMKLVKIRETIVKEELSQANKDYIKRTLEREDRFIKKEFTYKKVKNYLRQSFDEEKEPAEEPAVEEVMSEEIVTKEAIASETKK